VRGRPARQASGAQEKSFVYQVAGGAEEYQRIRCSLHSLISFRQRHLRGGFFSSAIMITSYGNNGPPPGSCESDKAVWAGEMRERAALDRPHTLFLLCTGCHYSLGSQGYRFCNDANLELAAFRGNLCPRCREENITSIDARDCVIGLSTVGEVY
jgi:hypothetical protein